MSVAERVRLRRAEQGLPERVTDPTTLRRVAALLARHDEGPPEGADAKNDDMTVLLLKEGGRAPA